MLHLPPSVIAAGLSNYFSLYPPTGKSEVLEDIEAMVSTLQQRPSTKAWFILTPDMAFARWAWTPISNALVLVSELQAHAFLRAI